MNMGLTAVIAGRGSLPGFWIEKAAEKDTGCIVIDITVSGCDSMLEELSVSFCKINAGRLGDIIVKIKSLGISRAVLVGNLDRSEFFAGSGPDGTMQKLLSGLDDMNASGVFKAIEAVFRNEGIELLEQSLYLEDWLAEEGNMTPGVKIKGNISRDMKKAFELAVAASDLGIGQTVVVKNGIVLAVEALEGTNAAIIRSGELMQGGVVGKAAGGNQDLRFDVPVIGIDTIRIMITAGSSGLIVEAGKTLMLRKAEVLALAAANGIPVYGVKRND